MERRKLRTMKSSSRAFQHNLSNLMQLQQCYLYPNSQFIKAHLKKLKQKMGNGQAQAEAEQKKRQQGKAPEVNKKEEDLGEEEEEGEEMEEEEVKQKPLPKAPNNANQGGIKVSPPIAKKPSKQETIIKEKPAPIKADGTVIREEEKQKQLKDEEMRNLIEKQRKEQEMKQALEKQRQEEEMKQLIEKHKREEEARQQAVEKQRKEEEMKRFLEKKRMEEEAHRQALEKQRMEEEARQKLFEKQRMEEEFQRQVLEKKRLEEEARQKFIERQRMEEEARQKLIEKQRLEEEARQKLFDKQKTEEETRKQLFEKQRMEEETRSQLFEKQQKEEESRKQLLKKQQMEEEARKQILEKHRLEEEEMRRKLIEKQKQNEEIIKQRKEEEMRLAAEKQRQEEELKKEIQRQEEENRIALENKKAKVAEEEMKEQLLEKQKRDEEMRRLEAEHKARMELLIKQQLEEEEKLKREVMEQQRREEEKKVSQKLQMEEEIKRKQRLLLEKQKAEEEMKLKHKSKPQIIPAAVNIEEKSVPKVPQNDEIKVIKAYRPEVLEETKDTLKQNKTINYYPTINTKLPDISKDEPIDEEVGVVELEDTKEELNFVKIQEKAYSPFAQKLFNKPHEKTVVIPLDEGPRASPIESVPQTKPDESLQKPPVVVETKSIIKPDPTDMIKIPMICLNYPVPNGTYGLLYVEVGRNEKFGQLKAILAKAYQVPVSAVTVFHKGIELPDDIALSLGYPKGEILYFSIKLAKSGIVEVKVETVYEKQCCFFDSNRPIWMKDYCVTGTEAKPFFWLEESTSLYIKAEGLFNKLKATDSIIASLDLDGLVDVDLSLLGLWESFEKDAMAAVQKLSEASISAITLPTIFGYPEIVYYYNGILIFPTFKGHVFLILQFKIAMAKGGKNTKITYRKAPWNYNWHVMSNRDIQWTIRCLCLITTNYQFLVLWLEYCRRPCMQERQRN
eukprot:TRINITY_DN437_c0_g1_i3.p1 TRINITY_DN437_c0_g1~~TRINITY_DN437_c0_g1_i3.p1  ORF type:complete len:959 (-),score=192.97 TRINITY_DN437_c0_g1_i3:11139-14015(-)